MSNSSSNWPTASCICLQYSWLYKIAQYFLCVTPLISNHHTQLMLLLWSTRSVPLSSLELLGNKNNLEVISTYHEWTCHIDRDRMRPCFNFLSYSITDCAWFLLTHLATLCAGAGRERHVPRTELFLIIYIFFTKNKIKWKCTSAPLRECKRIAVF